MKETMYEVIDAIISEEEERRSTITNKDEEDYNIYAPLKRKFKKKYLYDCVEHFSNGHNKRSCNKAEELGTIMARRKYGFESDINIIKEIVG